MPHAEVPVKVTAWVDEGVAPLVIALNELDDGLMTLDSCQGDDEHQAHVFFAHRGDARAQALFAADLAAMLAPHDDAADYVLTAEWRPGRAEPVFRLVLPAAQTGRLARALSSASGSARGTCGRALRS
jgi:hypothetical protein